MLQPNDCRFCRIIHGHDTSSPVDAPFLESESYVAIASIGALIEGWSLVVPREHCLSLRDHYRDLEFTAFRKAVASRVMSEYGPTVMFEHGPNHCGSPTGCGTDHAHLHIVPSQFPVTAALHESGIAFWMRARASELPCLLEGSEYLFFSDSAADDDPLGFFLRVTEPSSQFFRKAIARAIGKEAASDYKTHPHLDLSVRTRERLARAA